METLLVFRSSFSNKFWKITVADTSFAVNYGKIGTAGSVNVKDFPTPEACKKEAHRLIQSKLKKGYQPAVSTDPLIKESAMTEAYFWQLLDRCKEKGDDSEEQMEWLASQLAKGPVIDILGFDSILKKHYSQSYTSDLWAAAYIAMGGCSDDCFDYFRAWLLYLGKDTYYEAIENPETLLPYFGLMQEQGEIPQLEEFLMVACEAFEEKTGRDMEDYWKLYEQLMQDEEPDPEIDFDWDEDDEEGLSRMFPQLWAAFGENPL